MAQVTRAGFQVEDWSGPGPGEVLADDCPCNRQFVLDKAHHDWLLSFEERGIVGVVELIHYLELDADGEGIPGDHRRHVSWIDWPDFVRLHNWQNPADVSDLVRFIDDALRMHLARAAAVRSAVV